jgi:hypothetical protein
MSWAKLLSRTGLSVFLLGVVLPGVEARVGESISRLEERLLSGRTAVRYSPHEVEGMVFHASTPYRELLRFLPDGFTHHYYFKPAEDRRASRRDIDDRTFSPGWHLHVISLRGVSVFEAYRRSGAPLSDAEVEGLLLLNRGASHWGRVSADAVSKSAFGYLYEREDGELRAHRMGSTLLIFRPSLDERLHEARAEHLERVRRREMEAAPDSLSGF